MKTDDPLKTFEEMVARMTPAAPPVVHVASLVMGRIRTAEADTDRTLTLMAALSFCAAVVVVLVGMQLMPVEAGAIEGIFEIVPPIALP